MSKLKPRHKFGAKPTTVNGIRYDSKLEARYAAKLDLAKKAGDLLFYLRQVPVDLPGGIKYRCDFLEFWADGDVKFVDVKGMPPTEAFRIKQKQIEELYPFDLHIVRQVD